MQRQDQINQQSDEAFVSFLESLPEAHESVLYGFLNDARQAATLADLNIAAGIACEKLSDGS